MKRPLISVIIPTYKRLPKRIEKSIHSVQSQTYDNIEIIIVDDSPNDFEGRSSVENFIVNLKDPRIKYIQHETNKGANYARNTGIKNSTGEYCAFLDDDDEWIDNKLELQIEKFYNDSSIGLVYCKAAIINENDQTTSVMFNELHSGYQYERLLRQNFIGSNSYVLIKKEAFNEVGIYDQNLLSHQDYDLFLRITKKYKIDFVDKILVNYHIHIEERISTNSTKLLQGRTELYAKFQKDIEKDKELSNIWKLKLVPILYINNKKKAAILNFISLILSSPIFTVNYLSATLKFKLVQMINKNKS